MRTGTPVYHPKSGLTDLIDGHSVHPDGKSVVRFQRADKWFFAEDCKPASEAP